MNFSMGLRMSGVRRFDAKFKKFETAREEDS